MDTDPSSRVHIPGAAAAFFTTLIDNSRRLDILTYSHKLMLYLPVAKVSTMQPDYLEPLAKLRTGC